MSLKPPKKSDLDKGWMKKRLDREIRIQPEYHLIVSEGTNAEPQYFQAMRDVINLFEKARKRVSENPNGYKHVWVVSSTFQLFSIRY